MVLYLNQSDTVTQKILELFKIKGIKVDDIQFIGEGVNSSVYRVEGDEIYGIKISKFPERRKKVLQEVKIREKFINLGLDFIPTTYYSDVEIFEDSAVIYQYIDGEKPDFDDKDILEKFALTLSKIHSIELEIFDNGYEVFLENFKSLMETHENAKEEYRDFMGDELIELMGEAISELEEYLSKRRKYFGVGLRSWLHGDLHNNFIVDQEGKVWLIDWENSEFRDLIEEIFFFAQDNLNDEAFDYFIQHYKKVFPAVRKIDFHNIRDAYLSLNPLFYIYWGFDIAHTYLKNGIDIKQKYIDIIDSAKMISDYLDKRTADNILKAIENGPIAKIISDQS